MVIDHLNQMHREERVQKFLLLFSIAGTAVVILLINFLSGFSASEAEVNGVVNAATPEESAVEKVTDDVETEDNNNTLPAEDIELLVPVGLQSEAKTETVSEEYPVENNVVAQTQGIVTGFVIRRGHDTPLRNLRLRLVEDNGNLVASTRSGSDGSFQFTNVAPGKYYLQTVSENFTYRAKPILLDGSGALDVSFAVTPNEPSVELPAYVQFRHGKEVPQVEALVYRFGKVRYNLYRLEASDSILNATTLDQISQQNVADLILMDSFEQSYKYSVPFSEKSDTLEFDLHNPGLYLLEARAGRQSYRSLISLSAIDVVTTHDGLNMTVMILGLGGANSSAAALVKVMQNGNLVCEDSTNSAGMLELMLTAQENLDLFVSDGNSFVFTRVELASDKLVAR